MIGLIKGTARQVKSVSGLPLPIASYNGNLKAPIKKLSLSINPTQSGSGDPAPDNIRPITGVSSVNVTRTGKNIAPTDNFLKANGWQFDSANNVYYGSTVNLQAYYNGITTHQFIPTKEYGRCTVSFKFKNSSTTSQNSKLSVNFYYSDGTTSYKNCGYHEDYFDYTYTSLEDKSVIGIAFGYQGGATIYIKDFQMEKGDQATDYEAYQGNTYTIDLDGTRYGGTIDIVDGEAVMTVTKQVLDKTYFPSMSVYFNIEVGIIRSFWLSLPANFRKQDTFVNSNFFTPQPLTANHAYDVEVTESYANRQKIYFSISNVDYPAITAEQAKQFLIDNDVQFEFNFATPVEVNLGSVSIPSLLGQNNLWHDGNGDVDELVYQNRQLYYGR